MALSARKQAKADLAKRRERIRKAFPYPPLDAHVEDEIRRYLDTGEIGFRIAVRMGSAST